MVETSSTRIRWERFLIALGVVMYVLEYPHGIHGDGSVRYDSLLLLIREHRFAPILYSYVGPLFSAPLLLLGAVVKDGFWWISRFNTWIFLGTSFYAAAQLRKSWGNDSSRQFLLLMMAATMFPFHVTDYYSEVFSACLVFAAILEFQAGRSVLSILLVTFSTWNTPGTALASVLLLVFFTLRSRSFRYSAAVPLLPLGICAENFLKFGELFPKAYVLAEGQHNYLPYSGGPGFTYPLFFGVLSVFLSFGKGLVFFAPGILAVFCRRLWSEDAKAKERMQAGWIYLLGLVLVFSRWWSWYGGWFWGPRFFLFASVLGVVSLVELLRMSNLSRAWRVFWIFATSLSLWVGCQGVLYGQDFLEDCYVRDTKLEFICQYVPEYSVLWRLFSVWPIPTGRKWAYLAYSLLVAGTVLSGPLRRLFREFYLELRMRVTAAIGYSWRF